MIQEVVEIEEIRLTFPMRCLADKVNLTTLIRGRVHELLGKDGWLLSKIMEIAVRRPGKNDACFDVTVMLEKTRKEEVTVWESPWQEAPKPKATPAPEAESVTFSSPDELWGWMRKKAGGKGPSLPRKPVKPKPEPAARVGRVFNFEHE